MKKYNHPLSFGSLLLAACLVCSSCDKGFEEMNTNPDASPTVTPGYMFTKAQYDGASDLLVLLMGTMQYTTSYNDVAGFGSKYVTSQNTQAYGLFTTAYPKEINEIGEVIRAVQDDPTKVNLLSAARVWRVYCFSRLTDMYGDIPYSEAGLGYVSSIYKPKYDAQESIYADMLKELDEAGSSFDASQPNFGNADLLYSGDVTKWKKFTYSLMLRLAMRMTKVSAANAEQWAKKAITAGVIRDDADVADINYLNTGQVINQNPLSYNLLNSDYIRADGVSNTEGGKYQESFINFLKSNNDPRLPVLSIVYVNKTADTTVAIQKGMPATFSAKPADFVTYSEPNPKTILKLDAPLAILTNVETSFLLAEAALKGWYATETASDLYSNGIRAAMRQWALFGAGGVIPNAKIEKYVSDHALNTAGTDDEQMEQIYTQFWVGVFPNAVEVFSTYRRTGYPALIPNNYAGNATGGQIFRRMIYPNTEQNLNAQNYNDVLSRQGKDDFMTRMWWDTE
jgi:hypothetical protein